MSPCCENVNVLGGENFSETVSANCQHLAIKVDRDLIQSAWGMGSTAVKETHHTISGTPFIGEQLGMQMISGILKGVDQALARASRSKLGV